MLSVNICYFVIAVFENFGAPAYFSLSSIRRYFVFSCIIPKIYIYVSKQWVMLVNQVEDEYVPVLKAH